MKDMYLRIRKDARTKKDYRFAVIIALVIVCFGLFCIPIGNVIRLSYRYKVFTKEFTESLNYAKDHGGVLVSTDQAKYVLSDTKGSNFYRALISAGAGKPQTASPAEGVITLSFRDGSRMQLWESEVHGKSRLRDLGLFVSYQNPDGVLYQYDTDRLGFSEVAGWLKE